MRRQSILSTACALAAAYAMAGTTRPVFLNYDDTHFAYSRDKAGITPDEAACRRLVRQYEGTQVSDMLFCAGGRIADIPNGAKESWCDKYHQTRENGQAVCYTNLPLRLYREMWEVRKLDCYALWIDEARKIGIRPWLSFRLNDCHCCFEKTSFLHPNFYHDHPEYRRIRHRKAMGYFDRCFDFEFEAVRNRELDFIREMLERYDPDGIELDWMREIFCFAPGRENAATICGFMREVRRLTNRAAQRRGHAVRVAARVPADPETALRYGFDAAAWADEKLVDTLVPCPRWEITDNEIPVDLWKRLLRGSDVRVIPGVELIQRPARNAQPKILTTTEQLVGATAAFYTQDADGLYLYNYFDDPSCDNMLATLWGSVGQPPGSIAVAWPNQIKWLKFIGDPEKVLAAPRDHTITYRDILPLWEQTAAPFPRKVASGTVEFFRVVTGMVPAKRAVTLRLGTTGTERPRVFVNSRTCRHLRDEADAVNGALSVYAVSDYAENLAVVEVLAKEDLSVTHLDIQVREMP